MIENGTVGLWTSPLGCSRSLANPPLPRGKSNFSITNGLLIVLTLLIIDIALAAAQRRWPRVGKVFSGVPTVIVAAGRPLKELMERARVEGEDVLEAARRLRGLERMDQIRYAILEKSGGISIIPK